jgi:putative pyruvate formate lyase activating enzyme
VYNCSGYERVETLQLLEGIIDIWLPDAKYADDAVALRLSGFPDYVKHNRAALLEMYRQVGDIRVIDGEGIMKRGIIIRHLVLPNKLAGTKEVLEWIAKNLSPHVYISLMSQYFPAHRCVDDPEMGRKITQDEYEEAFAALTAAGFEDGWVQECGDESG